MKHSFFRFSLISLGFTLFACGQQPRVDGSGVVKRELYDRKIRRITSDMFVSSTLSLGDSLNASIMLNATDLEGCRKHADSIASLTDYKLGVYTDEKALSGSNREREMVSSALYEWQLHHAITPLAQKLGDTAWMYVAPAVVKAKGKNDTVGITSIVFPLKLIIREMNIKGVG